MSIKPVSLIKEIIILIGANPHSSFELSITTNITLNTFLSYSVNKIRSDHNLEFGHDKSKTARGPSGETDPKTQFKTADNSI